MSDEVVPSRLLTSRGVFVVFLRLWYMPDVAEWLEVVVARDAQSLFVCLCTIHVSVV